MFIFRGRRGKNKDKVVSNRETFRWNYWIILKSHYGTIESSNRSHHLESMPKSRDQTCDTRQTFMFRMQQFSFTVNPSRKLRRLIFN